MPTLLLRFPGRRYHATRWGHHVNEGLIEWPPSPWRMVRALLSVGYSALGWNESLSEPWRSSPPEAARSLIVKLAGVLPSYSLPPAVGTHSRHYMPVGEFKDGRERTTLVFDTWAQIEQGVLAVTWNVSLAPEEIRLLGQLATHLGYLGRSESWVEAQLAEDTEVPGLQINCRPCAGQLSPGPGWEQVALLAPLPSAEYANWLQASLQHTLRGLPLPEGKRVPAALQKKRAAAQEPYPTDVLSCLQVDTTWLREHGWSQPPGSRRVLYWRRADALSAEPVVHEPMSSTSAVPFVLLSLTTQSGNNHALPVPARSLPQGEMLHRQMVAARMRLAPNEHSRVLTGCDESGAALRGAHGHAHVLSLDLDDDGHIDHLLVWAPDGLDALDQRALRMTRGTYTKGGVGALRLAWAGAGRHDDLHRFPAPFGHALARTAGRSRVWTSATPFVAPRHLKANGANALEGQVRAELASRGLPEPQSIHRLDPQLDEQARRLRHHVRVRRHGKPPPADIGFMLRIEFNDLITGPLCLGYGSHFGLGRFESETGAS